MKISEVEYVESRITDITCPIKREAAQKYHSQRYLQISKLAWAFVAAYRKGGINYAFPNLANENPNTQRPTLPDSSRHADISGSASFSVGKIEDVADSSVDNNFDNIYSGTVPDSL
jgi:hypothetical protein